MYVHIFCPFLNWVAYFSSLSFNSSLCKIELACSAYAGFIVPKVSCFRDVITYRNKDEIREKYIILMSCSYSKQESISVSWSPVIVGGNKNRDGARELVLFNFL